MYITTKRLVLRPFSEGDCDVLAELLSSEQIGKTYMLPDFQSREQYLDLARRLRELSADENRFVAGIYLEDVLIGFLNDVEIEDRRIELGYVINPARQNRGYATEALRGVIRYLLRQGFREVTAGAFEENAASRRVMEKAGMIPLDREDRIEYRGKNHRCVYYSTAQGAQFPEF